VIDAAPRDVSDVQKAIDSTEIDECAVVGDVLYHTIEDLAFLKPLDQFGPLLRAGLLQHGAPGHDDVATGPVHLEDLERLRRAHQRTDVAYGADIHLAARQERHRAAEVHGEAALHPAIDCAVDSLLGLERLFEVGPRFLAPRLFARQDDGAVPVLVALHIEFDDIARLDFGLGARRAEFLEGHAALGLQADIDDSVFVCQAKDASGDYRAIEAGVLAERFIEEGGEIFALEMVLQWSGRRRCACDSGG
jgi:hypothetical protein